MKTLKAVRPEIQAILVKRDTQGLRFAIWVGIGLVLNAYPTLLVTASGLKEMILSYSFYAALLLMLVFMMKLLKTEKRLILVGYMFIFNEIVLIIVIPFTWYYSVGGSAVPASYLLKTVYIPLFLILIVTSTLPNRPVYPLLVTAGCIIVTFVHMYLAVIDQRSAFTYDYKEALFGPPASINIFIFNTVSLVLVGMLCMLLAHRSRRTVTEAVVLENSNTQLSRYFSPNIVKKISTEESSFFKPGGSVHDVAVLFSDIRSFTSISESLPPDEVLRLLSNYHERMVHALFAHSGTLDKFIGDGIMATFGTPDPSPDDAARAVKAGLMMRQALADMNEERTCQGLPIIRHGIGIHYGSALVGNVGTSERLEFTVIGDTVNVASRIESACKETGRDFLVSDAVRERLDGEVRMEDLGFIDVRGKNVPINIFAILEK